jgi:hypothetical protein
MVPHYETIVSMRLSEEMLGAREWHPQGPVAGTAANDRAPVSLLIVCLSPPASTDPTD